MPLSVSGQGRVPGAQGGGSVGDVRSEGRSLLECLSHQATAPSTLRERVVMKLSDVSVKADSGWRDVSDKRVAELVDCFVKEGLYGMGILRRPRVVSAHGKVKLASDGDIMLLDGKHTWTALNIVAKMYADAATVVEPGVGDFDVVEFSSVSFTP